MQSRLSVWCLSILISCFLRGNCLKPVLYEINGVTEVAPIFTLSEKTTLCAHPITQHDINNDHCTMAEPCIAAINRWDRLDECGMCYKLVYHQNETSNPSCADHVCPKMKKEVFIKIVEFYGFAPEVMFALYQQGFSNMCPYACRKTTLCVDSVDHCAAGVYPEEHMSTSRPDVSSVVVPGSTLSGRKIVSWEKVMCGTAQPVNVTRSK